MKLNNYVKSLKLTDTFINQMKDEDLPKLRQELSGLIKKFDILSIHEATEESFDVQQTLRYIECDLETYYRQEYKNKLMGLFVPWRSGLYSYFDSYELITSGDKFFIREWKNNAYMCMPVVSGHKYSHVITVETPEEMIMKGDDNIPESYANPFLCMLSFYCDLVEAVQKEVNEND